MVPVNKDYYTSTKSMLAARNEIFLSGDATIDWRPLPSCLSFLLPDDTCPFAACQLQKHLFAHNDVCIDWIESFFQRCTTATATTIISVISTRHTHLFVDDTIVAAVAAADVVGTSTDHFFLLGNPNGNHLLQVLLCFMSGLFCVLFFCTLYIHFQCSRSHFLASY